MSDTPTGAHPGTALAGRSRRTTDAHPTVRVARSVAASPYPPVVSGSAHGRRRRALVLVLLGVPALVLVLGALALAVVDADDRLATAPATAGSVLHPIAGPFEPDETALADCDDDVACFQQAFGNVAFRQGPREALASFESRMAADAIVKRHCHRIVHAIGSASLQRFRGDVARTFALGSPTCISGYYHGILERAFLGVSTLSQLADVARSLCASSGMRRHGFLDYQCRHGLGHGLMIQTGYHLPRSLAICAQLGTGWDRRACASGAFMENVDTRFGYRSRWLDDDDPLYPCRTVTLFDRRSCYLRASSRLLLANGGDYGRTGDACRRLGRWARACLQGLGREASEQASYGSAETRRLCSLTGRGEADCLFGAARTIANASGARGIAPARALCEATRAPGRSACFSGIGLVLGMLYGSDAARAAACERIAGGDAGACLRAARSEIDPSGITAWG
jgi:hypothetical protein